MIDTQASENPAFIFMGGVPRSGTSLLQKILDMNTNVYAGPEFDHLPLLCKIYNALKNGSESGRQAIYYDSYNLSNEFKGLVLNLLGKKALKEGVGIICEKTPANVLAFENLKELFPDAKFIFVVRDPRGSISSFLKVAARASEFGDEVNIGRDLIKDLLLINRYIRKGEVFFKNNKNICFLIHYEDLLSNPADQVIKLCEFLNIPYQQDMILLSNENDSSKLVNNQHKSVRAWATPGMLDKKIDASNSQKWRLNLNRIQVRIIEYYFSRKGYQCFEDYKFKESLLGMVAFSVLYFRYIIRKTFA